MRPPQTDDEVPAYWRALGLPGLVDTHVHVNDPGLVTRDYGYWVENELRRRFELQGVPVDIDFVARG